MVTGIDLTTRMSAEDGGVDYADPWRADSDDESENAGDRSRSIVVESQLGEEGAVEDMDPVHKFPQTAPIDEG